MGAADQNLATLRDPLPEEASRWHKPHKMSAAERMSPLADVLLQDDTFRLVKRSGKTTELVVDTGLGSSLRVTLREESIDIRIGPRLLQPDKDPRTHLQYLDEVSSLVEVLQLATGFEVFTEELLGFDAKGVCPSCGVVVYDWQDTCEACDAKLHALRPNEDEHDGHAQRVADFLIRKEMLELASPRGRRNVERTLSMYYAYDGNKPEVLHSLLMDMADVAELYCDVPELARVLRRIK